VDQGAEIRLQPVPDPKNVFEDGTVFAVPGTVLFDALQWMPTDRRKEVMRRWATEDEQDPRPAITKTRTKYPGISKITTVTGETKYRLIIVVGKVPGTKPIRYIQECHTFGTMKEALNKQAEIRDARKRRVLVKRENVTFDDLCQRWLDSRHDVRGHPTRIRLRAEVSTRSARPGEGTRSQPGRHRERDQDTPDRKLSHRAIVYTLGTVRQVLDYGISSGLLSINVAASVKAPRKQHSQAVADTKPKDEPWSQEELLRFRTVADQHEWAAAWRLTLCGLPRSEIMGMTWDCVDLELGEIKVEHGRVLLDGHRTATDDPKSATSRRTVPVDGIHAGTVALLRALRARQARDRLMLGAGYPETGLVVVNAALGDHTA
jgi:integrase